MPLINTVKTFVDGQDLTPYRFWKDTGIARKTAYDLYNDENHLPSARSLKLICERYQIQPNAVLHLVKAEEGNQLS